MKIIFPLVFVLNSLSLFAQTDSVKLKFDLSVRYRLERWEGMNAKNYGDDSPGAIGRLDDKILYQRFIAGFTWIPAPPVTVSLHLQDSRAFGWSLRDKKNPMCLRSGNRVPTNLII